MTSALNQLGSPIEIPSPLPTASSPIAKILNKPDLLSLVFSCLDWDQRGKQMTTCRDFKISGEKSVLDEMKKTTDLTHVFHKYICWFAHKKYVFPLEMTAAENNIFHYNQGVFEQLVALEVEGLNSLPQERLSTYLQNDVSQILPITRPVLTRVFQNCPNLTTISPDIFVTASFVDEHKYEDNLNRDCVLLLMMGISHLVDQHITTLHLGDYILAANHLLPKNIYPQLSTLSLNIQDTGELEAASAFAIKFPKLEFLDVCIDTEHFLSVRVGLSADDILRFDLPQLRSVRFDGEEVNLELITAVGEKYPRLKKLDLQIEVHLDVEESDFWFFSFFSELFHLEVTLYSDRTLSLKKDLSEEEKTEQIQTACEKGLEIIAEHCKKLRKVTLSAIDLPENLIVPGNLIKEYVLVNFCRNLPELTTFVVSADSSISLEEATELIKAAPKLTNFVFNVKGEEAAVTWDQAKIAEVRNTLREEKGAPIHKRPIQAIDEDEEKVSQPAPASASEAAVIASVELIEENTPKPKKVRKEE